MTRPVRIPIGGYWMITRRTLMRTFMLTPHGWVRELFAYAITRASNDTGVEVIGGSCMSSHYHLVVFDPRGDLPRFVGLLNELLARAGNAELERRDYFFESGGPHCMPLLTTEAIEEALVYALANPCEARLVARSRAWGGWQTQPAALGTTRVVARPRLRFFSERSVSPEEAVLTLHVPATHTRLGAAGFRALIAKRLKAREDELHRENEGRYLGMDKVLSFRWTDTAQCYEAGGAPGPKAKAGRVEEAPEIHRDYKAVLAVFWASHREAYEAMRSGEPAVFPYGTYHWRVFAGQACADPPRGERAVRC